MAGCRDLNPDELLSLRSKLKTLRDETLLVIGVRTGIRVGCLSGHRKNKITGVLEYTGLRVRDVWQAGRVVDRLYIQKRRMKGGYRSHELPLHPEARAMIEKLMATMPNAHPDQGLFQTRRGNMSRGMVHHVLKEAWEAAGLQGWRGTHFMRKGFAHVIFGKTDIISTMEALGHTDVRSTQRYVAVDKAKVHAAILSD
jgi:integrase